MNVSEEAEGATEQSPKFEQINKQSKKLIRRPWFLLSVSLDKINPYVNRIKRHK